MRNCLLLFGIALGLGARGAQIQLNFGDFVAGETPTNFHGALAGGGPPGEWKIVLDEAPRAFAPLMPQITPTTSVARQPVLAQLSQDPTNERFPMLVYDGETFKNFKLTTQFKIISGVAEQMAGVVFRFQNASNFYVVRVSALGHNLRFYKVVEGVRSDPIGPTLEIATNTWHTLAVQCQGNQITCWLDDRAVMPTLNDNSFSVGKVGFWTKSDAVSYFGNPTIDYTPIVPAAQSLVRDIIKEYPHIISLRLYTLDSQGQPRILASKDESEIGRPGTDAEKNAILSGTVSMGHSRGTVTTDMPLNDRNGEPIAAVRVELKSYSLAETQDMVLTRVRKILTDMQKRMLSKADLMQ